MIALLRGRPAGRLGTGIIIDVSGVGYLVTPPPDTAATLGGNGDHQQHVCPEIFVTVLVYGGERASHVLVQGYPVNGDNIGSLLSQLCNLRSLWCTRRHLLRPPDPVLAALASHSAHAFSESI